MVALAFRGRWGVREEKFAFACVEGVSFALCNAISLGISQFVGVGGGVGGCGFEYVGGVWWVVQDVRWVVVWG